MYNKCICLLQLHTSIKITVILIVFYIYISLLLFFLHIQQLNIIDMASKIIQYSIMILLRPSTDPFSFNLTNHDSKNTVFTATFGQFISFSISSPFFSSQTRLAFETQTKGKLQSKKKEGGEEKLKQANDDGDGVPVCMRDSE